MYKGKVVLKKTSKMRKRKRIRKKISGAGNIPRVHIFKSNRYMYAQAIDDEKGQVLASAST